MLRHKRAIALPFNYFMQFKKFSYDRNFHTSHCSLLRRIALSRKNPEVKQAPEENVAGNFEVVKPLTNPFENFYGIESDEGVIHVSEKPIPSKTVQESFIDKLHSKHLEEKLKKTCFGKVRLDAENKVTMHGQYDENTSLSVTDKTNKGIRLKSFQIEDTDTYLDKISPIVENDNLINDSSIGLDAVNNQTNSQFKTLESSSNELNSEIVSDASFIDKSYFPDKILKNEQEVISSQDSKENVSYIDACFFNEAVKENISFESSNNLNIDSSMKFDGVTNQINSQNETFKENIGKTYKHEPIKNTDEKLGYIDQSFFGSEIKEKLSAISTQQIDINKKPIESSAISNENMSFIDECFFNVDEKSEHALRNNKRSDENTSLSKTNSNHYANEIDRSRKTNINKISQSETEHNEKEFNGEEFQNYVGDTKTINTMTIKPETSYFNPHENQFSDDTSPRVLTSKIKKFSYNEEVKEKLRQTFNNSENSKLNYNLPNPEHPTLHNQSKSTHALNESNLLPKNKTADKNNEQGEQPAETAFDFVQKLRNETSATYYEKIHGFSKASKDKLDSKGFRILKNQVAELKYFTRDEMLELLVQNVLYSDDDVVVLNKPYNLVMHESQTTKDACLSMYLDDLAGELDKTSRKPKLLTVHRLDKETTGCLLLARNETSAQRLKSFFAQRKIVKTYWIVTIKVPDPLEGIIDIPIAEGKIDKRQRMVLHPILPKDNPYQNHSKRGKNAVTHYSVVAESGNAALVEVRPETGIKHQIRVHFGLGLSCPILGDHKYTYRDKLVPQKLPSDMLHRLGVRQSKVRYVPMHIYARSILIPQYSEGRNLFVMAPMPIHMSKNLQRLKFKKK